ncbi:MAG: TrbC/VirB2 family protein [Alphaproteobacteria bacterium]|nr:TrbC/VirB2 family protein [Alphaproteobacteria bacterium]
MKRYLSIFFYSFCCVALWATAALASSPLMDAINKYADIFIDLKPLVYICGAFGIMAVACAAFFGKMDWLRLAFIGIALMFLSLAGAIVDYLIDDDSLFDGGQSFASKLDSNSKDPLTMGGGSGGGSGGNGNGNTEPDSKNNDSDPVDGKSARDALKQQIEGDKNRGYDQYEIVENVDKNLPPTRAVSPYEYDQNKVERQKALQEALKNVAPKTGLDPLLNKKDSETRRQEMLQTLQNRHVNQYQSPAKSHGGSAGTVKPLGSASAGGGAGGSAGSVSAPILSSDEEDKNLSLEEWQEKKQKEMEDYAKKAEYKTNAQNIGQWKYLSPEEQAEYIKQQQQVLDVYNDQNKTEGFAFDQNAPTFESAQDPADRITQEGAQALREQVEKVAPGGPPSYIQDALNGLNK